MLELQFLLQQIQHMDDITKVKLHTKISTCLLPYCQDLISSSFFLILQIKSEIFSLLNILDVFIKIRKLLSKTYMTVSLFEHISLLLRNSNQLLLSHFIRNWLISTLKKENNNAILVNKAKTIQQQEAFLHWSDFVKPG